MTDVYGEYRRKGAVREDPRLARRDRDANSRDKPPTPEVKAGPLSPGTKTGDSVPLNVDNMWHSQTTQYNANMQTAYQHLGPSVYGDPSQYSNQVYATGYSGYQHGYSTYNPYQGYPQQGTYTSGSLQPGPPGEEYPQNEWAPVNAGYSQMTAPPPAATVSTPPVAPKSENNHKKDAVAQELKQQKATMSKQREHYVQKLGVMRKELEFLVNQKEELVSDKSSEHDNSHILRENGKLQVEIQNKMKTVYDVIEMLTKIIGDNRTISELEEIYYDEGRKHRSRSDKYKSGSSSTVSYAGEKGADEGKYCYVYYDPELHWCRICDVFPNSAKEYLLHLHSKEHRQLTQETDMVDTPWHRLPPEPEMPSHEGGIKKRIPIKGLQFLISSSAWYCKLCDVWVGDLHCASQHLKSQAHNINYGNFIKMNPHWEIEWLRDRDKAFVRVTKKQLNSDDSDDSENDSNKKHKKRKDKTSPNKRDKKKKKQKKRKKHSSESSSSSSNSDSTSEDDKNEENDDKSKSIRVAMRNKIKLQTEMMLNEESTGKWEVIGRLVEEHKRKETTIAKDCGGNEEDHIINQWMTVSEPPDKDKKLFEDLKDRMKQKQDAEKQRLAELERKRMEKERQERELKEKQEQEVRAKEEERRRLQEELERQKEREREAIRFKTREKGSKRSISPDKSHVRRSRSRSRHRDRSPRYNGDSHGRRPSPGYDKKERSRRDERNGDRRDKSNSYKKPHFIGRMPLFKNKKSEEKVEKEIKKEDYDIPRQSRFQPGNLARAFIPEPEVVCFPKLSSIPPLMIPPPVLVVEPPEPPKITEPVPKAPPAPIINKNKEKKKADESKKEQKETTEYIGKEPMPLPPPPPMGLRDPQPSGEEPVSAEMLQSDYADSLNAMYSDTSQIRMDPNAMVHYQYGMDYGNMMYSHMYDYSQEAVDETCAVPPPPDSIPMEHTMPLQPPPLPPDDPNEDLAMLGISADDMAVQMI